LLRTPILYQQSGQNYDVDHHDTISTTALDTLVLYFAMHATIESNAQASFERMLSTLYLPLLGAPTGWGKCSPGDRQEYLAGLHKYLEAARALKILVHAYTLFSHLDKSDLIF